LKSKQLAQAKTLLRRMSQTVEDIEDARTIERAKRASGNKPRIPWAQVKRIEVGLTDSTDVFIKPNLAAQFHVPCAVMLFRHNGTQRWNSGISDIFWPWVKP